MRVLPYLVCLIWFHYLLQALSKDMSGNIRYNYSELKYYHLCLVTITYIINLAK